MLVEPQEEPPFRDETGLCVWCLLFFFFFFSFLVVVVVVVNFTETLATLETLEVRCRTSRTSG